MDRTAAATRATARRCSIVRPPLLAVALVSCLVATAAATTTTGELRAGDVHPRRVLREAALAANSGSSSSAVDVAPDCDVKYYRFSSTHTACRQRSPTARNEGVDEFAKKLIVSVHNRYRAQVDRYQQPSAANMQRLYWDDELASVAQSWAGNCYWEHDASADRAIPGSYSVGQNLARGHQNWSLVVAHWQSEHKYLKFKEGRTARQPIGHYTQVVWAESARVGCGYALCNGSQDFYVCNYAPTGNHIQRQFEPYKAGPPGADCRRSFKEGLCDCGGKVCKNGGTLDPNTCTCTCPKMPWIGGSDCSISCDKATDSTMCQSKGGSWNKETCRNYINVPSEYCPLMCGLCPEKATEVASAAAAPDVQARTSASAKDQRSLLELLGLLDLDGDRLAGHGETTRTPTTTATNSRGGGMKASLPICPTAEPARCGQPGAAGGAHHPASSCTSGAVQAACPAMCGRCSATSCRAHDGRIYREGTTWLTDYGTHRCTRQGAVVTRGCYLAELEQYMRRNTAAKFGQRHSQQQYDCECSANFALKCSVQTCTTENSTRSCAIRWTFEL